MFQGMSGFIRIFISMFLIGWERMAIGVGMRESPNHMDPKECCLG